MVPVLLEYLNFDVTNAIVVSGYNNYTTNTKNNKNVVN